MIAASLPCFSGQGPTRIWLACGATDMRKGFDGLAVLVEQALTEDPHAGAVFAFRGKRGDLIKPHRGAALDGAGRHRLATPGTDLETVARRLIEAGLRRFCWSEQA